MKDFQHTKIAENIQKLNIPPIIIVPSKFQNPVNCVYIIIFMYLLSFATVLQ